MMGIGGLSSTGSMSNSSSMPRNCGMQGMHGNSQTNQVPKTDDGVAEQQTKQQSELLKVSKGNKIDIRI